MAVIIDTDVNFDSQDFTKLQKEFPKAAFAIMQSVGKGTRGVLSSLVDGIGSPVNLRAYPKDKLGRFTISSSVSQKSGIASKVRITSYPLNLFEFGRRLRNGSMEPGKRIITGDLTNKMKTKAPRLFSRAIDKHMGD